MYYCCRPLWCEMRELILCSISICWTSRFCRMADECHKQLGERVNTTQCTKPAPGRSFYSAHAHCFSDTVTAHRCALCDAVRLVDSALDPTGHCPDWDIPTLPRHNYHNLDPHGDPQHHCIYETFTFVSAEFFVISFPSCQSEVAMSIVFSSRIIAISQLFAFSC